MQITLSRETQALIDERLQCGGYSSAEDVVRVALDALQQVENEQIDDRDIADIRQAIEQMKQGQVVDWKHFSQEVRSKYLGACCCTMPKWRE